MTRKEIEEKFSIGSRVVHNTMYKPAAFHGLFARVMGYEPDYDDQDYDSYRLVLEWEDPKFQSEWGTKIRIWNAYRFTLVHGPAVQEPENHDGMIYNPITKQWSWF